MVHKKKKGKIIKEENSEAILQFKTSSYQWNEKIMNVFNEISNELRNKHLEERQQRELDSLELIMNEENINIITLKKIKEKEQINLEKWM